MEAVSPGLQSSLPTRGLRFLEYGYQQGPRFKKFSKQLFEIQVNEQTKKIWRKFGPCNVTLVIVLIKPSLTGNVNL